MVACDIGEDLTKRGNGGAQSGDGKRPDIFGNKELKEVGVRRRLRIMAVTRARRSDQSFVYDVSGRPECSVHFETVKVFKNGHAMPPDLTKAWPTPVLIVSPTSVLFRAPAFPVSRAAVRVNSARICDLLVLLGVLCAKLDPRQEVRMTQSYAWSQNAGTGRGYPDWEAAQAGPGAGTQVVPVFFRITQSVSTGPLSDGAGGLSVSSLVAQLAVFGGVLPDDEADRLHTESQALKQQGQALDDWDWRSVTYLLRDQLPGFDTAPGFAVLYVGPAIAAGMTLVGAPTITDLSPAASLRLGPAQGIIDDGLPYLNARFQAPVGKSRFAAVWLQTDARWDAPMTEPKVGRVLRTQDINTMIAEGDEPTVYRRVNRTLLPVTEHASSNHHVSHGAHVLDVAAGVAPENSESPLCDVPLLGVQLPPTAVSDTSGRRNEGYVVMGLRWMLRQLLAENQTAGRRPFVVTLTMGALAGPGDGTQFLADWLRHEIDSYALVPGQKLYLCMAYGNARRDRLVARAKITASQPAALDWRTLPEDYTPSFAELRLRRADRTGPLTLVLTPPSPAMPPLRLTWDRDMTEAQVLSLPGSAPVAAVYPMAEPDTEALLIALAPTARYDSGPRAPAGRWCVSVEGAGTAGVLVTLRVQRDETPAGYRIQGRQSYLDHPLGWEWDYQTRDWIKPLEPGMRDAAVAPCPVTRRGSPVAHAGLTHPQAVFVGSVKPIAGNPDGRVMALYSAEGVETADPLNQGESAGPDLSALADDGSNLFGRLGSGIVSGSRVRLSGTSVAAPALARALTLALIEAQATGAADPSIDDLIGPALLEPPRVMGRGALKGQAPYRPERSGRRIAMV